MAKITTVKYRMNVPSAGNKFLHQHAEIEVTLEKGDTVDKAFALAKSEVRRMLGVDITAEEVAKARKIVNKADRFGKDFFEDDFNDE